MTENRIEVLVGAAVLIVAAGFLYFLTSVTGLGNGGGGQYQLTASFRSVQGVSVGTDVRIAGVKVGEITGLSLNPQTFRADATLSMNDSLELPDDSAILVSSEGLLGGNFIEIIPGGSPFNLEPGAEIEDTQGSISIVNLLMKFVGSAAGGEGAE